MTVSTRENVSGEEATATIVWDGPRTRCEYEIRPPERKARLIELPGSLYWYQPGIEQVRIATGTRPGAGYSSILEVQPSRCWYREGGPYSKADKLRWRVMLDPEQAPDSVTKYVVTKAPDEQVIVERHYFTGSHLRIVASLLYGGNIVAYEKILSEEEQDWGPSKAVFWEQGSYEWADAGSGRWYPKHMECRESSVGDPEKLNYDFVMDVKSFEPDVRVPPSQFTFASLNLAPGTTVEETGKRKRTYRVAGGGKEKKGIERDRLDALGESLRKSGFAEPRRSDE
ncbi:MAG: hypothetical protein WBC44_09280 [Planctomycetaceae bacterium]